MELVRLTTFINLFPEKIARTNVRHSPRSVYETSTSIDTILKTKILASFLLFFFAFFDFFFLFYFFDFPFVLFAFLISLFHFFFLFFYKFF